jgi:hypothetical protein
MGIKKFDEFVNATKLNESFASNPIIEEINEPFNDFILTMQENVKRIEKTIEYRLHNINLAIERLLEEMEGEIIVGPKINIYNDLSCVTVDFETNIIYTDEHYVDEEDFEKDIEPSWSELENRVYDIIGDLTKKGIKCGVRSNQNPKDNDTCVIYIESYMIDEEVFEDATDGIRKLGME